MTVLRAFSHLTPSVSGGHLVGALSRYVVCTRICSEKKQGKIKAYAQEGKEKETPGLDRSVLAGHTGYADSHSESDDDEAVQLSGARAPPRRQSLRERTPRRKAMMAEDEDEQEEVAVEDSNDEDWHE